MRRLVQPELLDTLPPDDPRARHSRRDLQRLNRIMGHLALLRRALHQHAPRPPGQLIELGAGDGSLLLRLAEKSARLWPSTQVTLLDRQESVSAATLASFAHLGWPAQMLVTDVFSWSPAPGPAPAVIANLFLHHFESDRLAELFRKIAPATQLFVALEPHRFTRPSLFRPLLRLLGCNEVTQHDAVVSIRAGFSGRELAALWPDPSHWELIERRAGLCSHLFIARRRA